MPKLTRVGVFFMAKVQAVMMAGVGLLAGFVYSLGGAVFDVLTVGFNTGTALAFMALIGMPVLFGALGFVTGAIGALVYNLVAWRFGGIETDFDLR